MKTLVMLLMLFLPSGVVFADGSLVGNGGHGVEMADGSLALFDFVDGGVSSPDLGDALVDQVPSEIVDRWRRAFGNEVSVPYDLLGQKVRQLQLVAGLGATQIASPFSNGALTWVFVDEAVVDPDDKTPVTDIGLRLVPIAVRRGAVVTISRPSFRRLSDAHRLGLIFHECASFLLESFVTNREERNIAVVSYLREIFGSGFRAYRRADIFERAYEPLLVLRPNSAQDLACRRLADFRTESLIYDFNTRTGVATPRTSYRELAGNVLSQAVRLLENTDRCLELASYRQRLVRALGSDLFSPGHGVQPIPVGASRRERRRLEANNRSLVTPEQMLLREQLWNQYATWRAAQ